MKCKKIGLGVFILSCLAFNCVLGGMAEAVSQADYEKCKKAKCVKGSSNYEQCKKDCGYKAK